jgi:hypothetical protein
MDLAERIQMRGERRRRRRGCVGCERRGKKENLIDHCTELFKVNIHASGEVDEPSFVGRKPEGFNQDARETHARRMARTFSVERKMELSD